MPPRNVESVGELLGSGYRPRFRRAGAAAMASATDEANGGAALAEPGAAAGGGAPVAAPRKASNSCRSLDPLNQKQ